MYVYIHVIIVITLHCCSAQYLFTIKCNCIYLQTYLTKYYKGPDEGQNYTQSIQETIHVYSYRKRQMTVHVCIFLLKSINDKIASINLTDF